MSETWTISVGNRVYGPYSAEQMRAFHAEGRLATHSLVARAGEEQFHPAGEDPELAPLFPVAAAETTEAQPEPAVQAQPEPRRFGQEADTSLGERSRFVVISDMKSGSISALEEKTFNLGHAFRFMPQALGADQRSLAQHHPPCLDAEAGQARHHLCGGYDP